MADEKTIINGVASETDDRAAESFNDVDQRVNEAKLTQKIEALEKEKLSLSNENEEIKDQMLQLRADIELLRSAESELKLRLQAMGKEMEVSEERKRALEFISKRAVQLETEVSRLQHDLITSMSEGEEANTEISKLKRVLGEKEVKLEELKKEKMDSEKKVKELEKKIGVLEVKEIEERNKRVRIEEEMRDKLSDKEKEMFYYKNRFMVLEEEVARKEELEEKLKASEEKVREIEEKMVELQKKVEEAEKVNGRVKERTVRAINGIQIEGMDKESKGLKVQWPVLAVGSTGAIAAAAAVVYICYARRT
ncbi:peroxisomal and mitochondrial division factor 2 [Manihot esculenta]|uniref:Uncharacterized protein n=3 Tax=Manihot esculenta TaxID=3983 RepID=A0ACB7ICG3_MANES|nr:peroxisomal and mitochondrial division factor 2 [Manihot esculenta]KAG8662606.1 hypothetical protein MANES_01G127500v8 [Manihot esculenta]KAG8662607.1 hypothetical protein MANES_01G127500v8 [Manihot esculenta]OAY60635.1 hypothetical protein MANES_01G127500v8 [Manihot esculenta]